MAVVEKTIGSGQDHATIADWEANVGVFGTDIYKGIISTNDEFDENISLTGSTGTPSITSYLWLTTDPANRHSGVAGTGHGRIRSTGSANTFNVGAAFSRFSWLEIELGKNGNSLEAIRLSNINDILIQYCIIWTDSGGANQDGILWNGSGDQLRTRIDNCIIYGFDRGGINFAQGANTDRTFTAFIDHCAIFDIQSGTLSGCIKQEADANGTVMTVDVFNTWASTTGSGHSPFSDSRTQDPAGTPDGSCTWNGSDNGLSTPADLDEIQGTDNLTATELATDGIAATTKSSGSWIVVNNITAGSEDLLLLDDAAGNIMAGRGINRQGSEPDARQDFSVDITGGSRPTSGVDIGPHQVSAAGQIVAVGTLVETDALIGITPVKPIIVGVGVLAEIDSLVPVVGIKVADIGTLAEVGSLIPVQARKIVNLGTLSEADSLVAIQALKPIITAVGLIGETDSLIPIQALKVAIIGTLGETDALVSIQALKPIIKAIGTPTESETAQVVLPEQGTIIVVGTASESETAQAIIVLKPIIKAIGFASETEITQAVDAIKVVTVGTPGEAEVAEVSIPFKTVILGTPIETEAAQVVAVVQPGGQDIVVGTATEVEAAQVVGAAKSVVMGFASESEAAQAVTTLKPIIQAIGTVAEIESAQGVAAIKPIITPVGTAAEIETAQIVRYVKVLQIGTATETEVPITVTIIKIVLVGQVSESEVAQIVVPGVFGLGDAGELLTADDTGKAVAVVVVSKVAVLYDVVKIRS